MYHVNLPFASEEFAPHPQRAVWQPLTAVKARTAGRQIVAEPEKSGRILVAPIIRIEEFNRARRQHKLFSPDFGAGPCGAPGNCSSSSRDFQFYIWEFSSCAFGSG
jgi:hypothetical protein